MEAWTRKDLDLPIFTGTSGMWRMNAGGSRKQNREPVRRQADKRKRDKPEVGAIQNTATIRDFGNMYFSMGDM
ncbi:hypothetical protein FACS189481_2890 [Clostridia bacterium]|nr:hypothetical protein FACS189481_2890 [Clostridia bacterium]